jgi:hypothetical protein
MILDPPAQEQLLLHINQTQTPQVLTSFLKSAHRHILLHLSIFFSRDWTTHSATSAAALVEDLTTTMTMMTTKLAATMTVQYYEFIHKLTFGSKLPGSMDA